MRSQKPILLVEDDQVDVLKVKRAFRELQVRNPLHIAHDGEEALQHLHDPERQRPGLILLDLDLPRMNGLEFLRHARRDSSLEGIPVVVLTTSSEENDLQEGYRLQIAGYMVKPMEYGEFLDLMQAIDTYWTHSELPT